MALNPPVLFRHGDWDSNTKYLVEMDILTQQAYGFHFSRNINADFVRFDPDSINGSTKILVFNRHGEIRPNLFFVIGYFSMALVEGESGSGFIQQLSMTYSSTLKGYLVRYWTGDSIGNFSLTKVTTDYIKFNEFRIMTCGLVSVTENWALALGNTLTLAALVDSSALKSYTLTETGIKYETISRPNVLISRIDIDVPGTSVLRQFEQGVNAWVIDGSQLPNAPVFMIWDNEIYAAIYGRLYIKMSGDVL